MALGIQLKVDWCSDWLDGKGHLMFLDLLVMHLRMKQVAVLL